MAKSAVVLLFFLLVAGLYFSPRLHHENKMTTAVPANDAESIQLARTYLSSKNPMRGIVMLQEMLKKDPSQPEALYHLGLLSLKTKQYKKAIDYLSRLVMVDPSRMEAMFYLGHAYLMDGQQDKGGAWLQRVKGLDGAFVEEASRYLGENI